MWVARCHTWSALGVVGAKVEEVLLKRLVVLSVPGSLLAVALGCSENTIVEKNEPVDPLSDQADPCITVDPTRVDFDPIRVSEDPAATAVVSVSNTCEGDLEIYALSVADVSAPFSVGSIGSVLLPQGSTTDFTITFDPKTSSTYTTEVLVDSNDPATPTAVVVVTGEGIAPIIDVSPDEYDFGSPYIGCVASQTYEISNIGNAPLMVEEFQFATPSAVDLEFRHDLTLPLEIAPEASAEVYVDYHPLDDFTDEAFLTVLSNDPFTPSYLVTATGSAGEYGDNLDVYEQPIKAATDVLFTLDRSCSMSEDLENVAANFATFINALSGVDADFHVAAAVDDSGCIRGADPYIDNTFNGADAVAAFETMANIYGSYGSNTERGFALAEAALSAGNVGPGGCNEGFYREDAYLAIVAVSDEPEQSPNPWTFYVGLWQSMKDDPEEFIYHAVAGDYPSGCGTADPGTGYYEATVATGGVFLSICADDWAAHLEVLAASSIAQKTSFGLTQPPVPDTIEVAIDGIDTTAGWVYDPKGNSVVFNIESIPPGGSTIEIEYQLLPPCDG